MRLRAGAFMTAAHAAYGITHLAALCRLLPERDPHEAVHEALEAVLDHLDDRSLAAALVARFELALLGELGFGLDLDQCAATGALADLIYVSPKSGRAISRVAGAPWRDRLLRLPAFLHEDGAPAPDDITAAFALTGFFLVRHVYEPRGGVLPDARERFIAAVLRERPVIAASG